MHATGIITEYNPFHYGHIHHILETRKKTKCDVLICLMSGNFVQRGEPAIVDKFIRSEYAIKYGVDLVIELPFWFATQSAFYFAEGAIHLLDKLLVQDIVFGSETNHLAHLQNNANQLLNKTFQNFKKNISNVKNYEKIFGNTYSNDILAINYLYHLKKTSILPHTILRTNEYHSLDIEQKIASASAIRNAFRNKLPHEHTTPMKLTRYRTQYLDTYFDYIKQFLLISDVDALTQYLLVDDGIESLLKKEIINAYNLNDFINRCTSSRYTNSRIQRTLLHILFQTKKTEINDIHKWNEIRVLASNKVGLCYLKYLKNNNVNVVTKFSDLSNFSQNNYLKQAKIYGFPNHIQEYIKKEVQSIKIIY